MPTLALADAEYAVRQWARGLTDLSALVNRRVDLHEPRSPDAAHVELSRAGGGPDGSGVGFDQPRIQFSCWGPTLKAAAQVATTLASAITALQGQRVVFVDDADGRAFCYGAVLESIGRDPRSDRQVAGYQLYATFILSPT